MVSYNAGVVTSGPNRWEAMNIQQKNIMDREGIDSRICYWTRPAFSTNNQVWW